MKRNNDYPEYKEYKAFRLTNDQRPYFGLDIIDMEWEEVEIKEGTNVFYDGDTIKKVIYWEKFSRYEYTEFDTEIMTRNRQFILPKTTGGKEKKLTHSNILNLIPSGCTLFIALKSGSLKSRVYSFCTRNNIHLPINDDKEIITINDLKEWIEEYINTCPTDYFEKVNKMITMHHRTIKYKVGDIFRFEIDRENYGFGLIIGKLRELEKKGVFSEEHPLPKAMGVPVLIRMYKLITKNKDLQINEVIQNELLATEIMSDGEFIWGTHEIVGCKKVDENDIDFPLQFGFTTRAIKKQAAFLAWGIGMIKIERIESVPIELKTNKFINNGGHILLPIYKLIRVLQGDSELNYLGDLRHPDNKEIKERVFQMFKQPVDIDFDTFNINNSGMTKKQYVDFVNKKSPLID